MAEKVKKKDDCIFFIDAGTQSIRAAIIDLKGAIREIVKTPIEPYYAEHPGWAEQDPEYYWHILSQTCKKLLKTTSFSTGAIRGVTVTPQRGTVINVDKQCSLLRPAITWLDQRKADKGPWPPIHPPAILKAVKMYEAGIYAYRETESNWIRQNQPRIWERTHKYLLLSGFFVHRLTGEFFESIGSMVGYMPFDYKKHQWMKKSDIKWGVFDYDLSLMPSLVKPADIMGHISKKASQETGIPAGLPVIAAAADKACEVLGSGCLKPEIACLSYGTTATVETTTDTNVEIVPFFPPYPSAVPGAYNTEVMIFRGYWMVSWFKKEFGLREVELAEKRNIAPETLFDQLVQDIPPGAMGLTLQPFWSPG